MKPITSAVARGFTLIEVVVTIALLGILSVGIMMPLSESLKNSNLPVQMNTAMSLAQSRLDLILANRSENGFDNYVDPCPGPSICNSPSGYSINVTITPNWQGNSNYDQITVVVSGEGNATLTSLSANY